VPVDFVDGAARPAKADSIMSLSHCFLKRYGFL